MSYPLLRSEAKGPLGWDRETWILPGLEHTQGGNHQIVGGVAEDAVGELVAY